MPNNHQKYMQLALRIAKRGGRAVRPNPLVGCVLVKNDRVISSGFHSFYGGPHAEVNALKNSPNKIKGAIAYLSLEPCSHWGKTPPCAPQLVNAGIKQVFIAMKDPNPKVHGRGIQYLQKHGCRVDVGLEREAAQKLNRPFITWILEKRPYVILKMAQSLDGKIATRSSDSRWVTSNDSRKAVHYMRADCDAVIIGAETAIKDNPALTSHGAGKNPLRVVLDPQLRTPDSLELYQPINLKKAPTVVVTTLSQDHARSKRLLTKGVIVLSVKAKAGKLNLNDLLKHLFAQGVYQVIVEGGGNTAWNFLEQKLVDEVNFYVAPKIVGGKEAVTSVEGTGISKMLEAFPIRDMSVTKIGSDFLFKGFLN